MEQLLIGNAELEYQVQGSGEPVLLIHLSLIADGLAQPLLTQKELASRYQLIHYHRRGYIGSWLGTEPLAMARQARDAAALLKHLGVKAAHIVGHSSGAGIALQLAVEAPDRVHTLALMEPALPAGPNRKADLERALGPMMTAYRSGDKPKAVEVFCESVFGSNWQTFVEQAVPGSIEQAVKDVDTFVNELSAFQSWQIGPAEAAVIHQPVLSVLGAYSSPFMQKGRALIHAWLPQTEDFDAPTTHLLQLQDPQGVARGLAAFFRCHPMQ